ncbi:MAG: hypothetical protein KGY75_08695 [Candidatus Cloacimonetes bacterium]|nr:hypothetical protein [Candidatus Cloacimonadota bacterium]
MALITLEALGALFVSLGTYFWKWWSVVFVFPFVLSFGNYHNPQMAQVDHMRNTVNIIILGYILSSVIIFQYHIGSWYGWLLGLVPSIFFTGFFITPKWHYYKLDKND